MLLELVFGIKRNMDDFMGITTIHSNAAEKITKN